MSAVLEITFTNLSSVTFSHDTEGAQMKGGVGSLNQAPGTTLQAFGGLQTMRYTQNLSVVMAGDAYIYCCWNDGDWRFGVRIYEPIQVLAMGSRPYWEVMHDHDLWNKSVSGWTEPGSDPAMPYSFPAEIGYRIDCAPYSEHSSLSVKVSIQDLKT